MTRGIMETMGYQGLKPADTPCPTPLGTRMTSHLSPRSLPLRDLAKPAVVFSPKSAQKPYGCGRTSIESTSYVSQSCTETIQKLCRFTQKLYGFTQKLRESTHLPRLAVKL
jgi:hypothetical protein